MAVVVKNSVNKNIGTTEQNIISTTVSSKITVIGLSLTNILDTIVYVDVIVKDNTSNIESFYLKDTMVPTGTSLRAVSTGEKLVLDQNNTMKIKSSVANSIDVIASYAEIV
jgi:hypothetical protein|tara:strand:+ start:2453 stop:2785 length:333 start_codon:yes stop_codon:yes gene_type:complete